MADRDDEPGDKNPEDEFRDMLRELLSGSGGIDPSQLAGAAGLPNDPASLAALFGQLQQAMNRAGDGIDWSVALRQGEERAASGQRQITADERARLDQALQVASLWLDEVVDFSALPETPELLTRRAWVAATMPVWSQLAEPVALSISDSLTRVMSEQAPEEMRSMIEGASRMMRGIGGALFAMQLGQVVGQLATEVVSGGDIGIPLQTDGRAALVPQNVAEFGDGLDIPTDQVELYLAVRELAHARLFRHARWLRLHLITRDHGVRASGIDIDTDRLEQLAEGFDPSNTDELRDAVVNGALIRPKSEAQQAALDRLETMLALVEGWVDAVTADATGTAAEVRRDRRVHPTTPGVGRPGRVGLRDARRPRAATAPPPRGHGDVARGHRRGRRRGARRAVGAPRPAADRRRPRRPERVSSRGSPAPTPPSPRPTTSSTRRSSSCCAARRPRRPARTARSRRPDPRLVGPPAPPVDGCRARRRRLGHALGMAPRIDPTLPLVWRSPTDLQLGARTRPRRAPRRRRRSRPGSIAALRHGASDRRPSARSARASAATADEVRPLLALLAPAFEPGSSAGRSSPGPARARPRRRGIRRARLRWRERVAVDADGAVARHLTGEPRAPSATTVRRRHAATTGADARRPRGRRRPVGGRTRAAPAVAPPRRAAPRHRLRRRRRARRPARRARATGRACAASTSPGATPTPRGPSIAAQLAGRPRRAAPPRAALDASALAVAGSTIGSRTARGRARRASFSLERPGAPPPTPARGAPRVRLPSSCRNRDGSRSPRCAPLDARPAQRQPTPCPRDADVEQPPLLVDRVEALRVRDRQHALGEARR